MKVQNESQEQKRKKMLIRNQQRCLNSQSLSKKRAYLSKQKCKQKIMRMEGDIMSFLQTSIILGDRTKNKKQQQRKQNKEEKNINENKIKKKQCDHVKLVINELQNKNKKQLEFQLYQRFKDKIYSCSTRLQTTHSPKSTDSINQPAMNNIMKNQTYQYCHRILNRKNQLNNQGGSNGQIRVSSNSKQKSRKVSLRISKAKNNNSMIKVYNPFPSPMNQLL